MDNNCKHLTNPMEQIHLDTSKSKERSVNLLRHFYVNEYESSQQKYKLQSIIIPLKLPKRRDTKGFKYEKLQTSGSLDDQPTKNYHLDIQTNITSQYMILYYDMSHSIQIMAISGERFAETDGWNVRGFVDHY